MNELCQQKWEGSSEGPQICDLVSCSVTWRAAGHTYIIMMMCWELGEKLERGLEYLSDLTSRSVSC